MRNKPQSLVGAALVLAWLCAPAAAQTMFGSLSNFDVVNDTGDVCRGFEIELEGVSSSDIYSTFGSPYIRYGEPTIVPTATGIIIRYLSLIHI